MTVQAASTYLAQVPDKAEELPPILLPRKGTFGLVDYEKAFSADLRTGQDIFDLRGIDRKAGAIVVVRPDQSVANVLPLDALDALADYFAASCSIVTEGRGADVIKRHPASQPL